MPLNFLFCYISKRWRCAVTISVLSSVYHELEQDKKISTFDTQRICLVTPNRLSFGSLYTSHYEFSRLLTILITLLLSAQPYTHTHKFCKHLRSNIPWFASFKNFPFRISKLISHFRISRFQMHFCTAQMIQSHIIKTPLDCIYCFIDTIYYCTFNQ